MRGRGVGVVSFYSPAVLLKSLYQSAVSFDTVLRFIKFFSAFLRFSQPFHSRLTIREFKVARLDFLGLIPPKFEH